MRIKIPGDRNEPFRRPPKRTFALAFRHTIVKQFQTYDRAGNFQVILHPLLHVLVMNDQDIRHSAISQCHARPHGFTRIIGKTALINEFCKDKPTVFFSALNASAQENLEALSKAVYEKYMGWYDGNNDKLTRVSWSVDYDKPLIFSEMGGGTMLNVIAIIPAGICTLLVIPIPNYHNVRVAIGEVVNFYSNNRNYVWRGWCARYESRDKQPK